ncbi:nucleoside-diphosphate-sugar epimerase [Azospirillum agricola]|uniref:NAD-dependent epimerase/dehydratase family protein n=1 Tax=Azospirillum agricola TaxID=1720247 RepID=UPI001AE6D034|nr:NAD(P)-dependent oxidoreductase [Azospirillum agricola]MBP2233271.1 nucleoside-diphosphate-sugar epimerase [Azospirillum agricola]
MTLVKGGGEASKPVLVTGASGFVGRALGMGLDAAGIGWIGASRANGFDLEDAAIGTRLPDCRILIHLAGRSGVPESWDRPAAYHRTNTLTTLAALEHARACGAGFVLMSSYMYGVPQRLPIDETHPVDCRNPYAHSKHHSELLCRAYAQDFGVPVTILRPFNIFGPGQGTGQVIPHILAQARNEPVIRVNDLTPRRDYLWIGDLVDALLRVISAPIDVSGRGPAVYNLGSGVSHSVAEIVDAVVSLVGPRRIVCADTARLNEIPDCVCDASRFRQAFGWQAMTDLPVGLRLMLDHADKGPMR